MTDKGLHGGLIRLYMLHHAVRGVDLWSRYQRKWGWLVFPAAIDDQVDDDLAP